MITSYILAKKRNLPSEPRCSMKEVWNSFIDSILAIMTMVIIIDGIIGGIFTPTGASVIATAYAFIVGFFVYKQLKIKDLPRIMVQTAITTGVVVLCITAASSLGWILAAERIPTKIAQIIFSFSTNKYIILD